MFAADHIFTLRVEAHVCKLIAPGRDATQTVYWELVRLMHPCAADVPNYNPPCHIRSSIVVFDLSRQGPSRWTQFDNPAPRCDAVSGGAQICGPAGPVPEPPGLPGGGGDDPEGRTPPPAVT